MNQKEITGQEIPLLTLLDCRETRKNKQEELLKKYNLPIICFTLNIPGPVKIYPLSIKAFEYAYKMLKNTLINKDISVKYEEIVPCESGNEAYFVLDCEAIKIKKITCELEENYSFARIFDIDVLNVKGEKISRTELGFAPRSCLICQNNGAVCSRNRTHGIEAVIEKTNQLLRQMVYNFKAKELAELCVSALLEEVYTTPKPGLVDRNNNGSHSDMNIELFEKSANSLHRYFEEMAIMGLNSKECKDVLPSLRPLGILAEEKMFSVTKGVNTHKGAIFSLGILCYCAAYIIGQGEKITAEKLKNTAKIVSQPAMADFAKVTEKNAKTNGELLYARNKDGGVRWEATEGFPCVFDLAYPIYTKKLQEGLSKNDSGVITLLHLISKIKDTNVLKRGGNEGLEWIQSYGKKLIKNTENVNFTEQLLEFDRETINMNLSSGGCADMLALTYFVADIIE